MIFPAGRVSTAPRVFDEAIDSPWKSFCATMALRARANILPIHFEEANSWLFHLVCIFSEALREALLLGEVSRRFGSELVANIGHTISYSEVEAMRDKQTVLDFPRGEVYRLAEK